MLHLIKLPLVPEESKIIQAWLGAPGHKQFLDYLAAEAAVFDVDAANALSNNENLNGAADAKEMSEKSFMLNAFIQFVNQCRDTDHQFFKVKITPQPNPEPTD